MFLTEESLTNAQRQEIKELNFDCHGLSFTNGLMWIDDDQAEKLIEHDGCMEGSENNSQFVAYYGVTECKEIDMKTDPSLMHTTPLNRDGSVNSKRGHGDQVNRSAVKKESEVYSVKVPIDFGVGPGYWGIQTCTKKYYKKNEN